MPQPSTFHCSLLPDSLSIFVTHLRTSCPALAANRRTWYLLSIRLVGELLWDNESIMSRKELSEYRAVSAHFTPAEAAALVLISAAHLLCFSIGPAQVRLSHSAQGLSLRRATKRHIALVISLQ